MSQDRGDEYQFKVNNYEFKWLKVNEKEWFLGKATAGHIVRWIGRLALMDTLNGSTNGCFIGVSADDGPIPIAIGANGDDHWWPLDSL